MDLAYFYYEAGHILLLNSARARKTRADPPVLRKKLPGQVH